MKLERQSLKIEYIPVNDLKAYEWNSRTHSAEQIEQISASIQEFGFVNPVLVGDDGVIVAGHGRLMAANRIGMTEVPTIRLGHLSDEQRRALVIADNQIATNAGWDADILGREIARLNSDDFELALLGFDEDALAALLDSQNDPIMGIVDEDDAPDLDDGMTVTNPANVWQMGGHRLMCGDSASLDDGVVLMGGCIADLLLTDPPYNVSYEGKTKDALKIENDSMGDADFREFLVGAYTVADENMKPGSAFYIWHADSEGLNFRGACADVGWKVRQCLIWKKNSIVMGRQDYHWKHEPCLYGWKDGAAHRWVSNRKQSTILEFDKPTRNDKHPTMKPVALFEYQMLNNTRGQDVVLDLFGGSGTTLIACEKNHRVARLMEIDPKYCDVIVKRWQNYTGKDAVLEGDGRTFNEIAGVAEEVA